MSKNRNGYGLLLMLLIVIVIGFIVYFFTNSWPMTDGQVAVDPNGEPLPWTEENRIAKQDGQVNMPSASQLSITDILSFKLYPTEKGQRRGEISVLVTPDGRVGGGWTGDFRDGQDLSYAILYGDFKGNVDSSKIRHTGSGEDPCSLYLIARGSFILLEENNKTNHSARRQGFMYVTGWLNPNGTFSSKIVLTSDKREYRIFTCQNCKPQTGGLF